MGKVQQCRNGCGAYITVQEDSGKWKPFDVDDDGRVLDLHNCPKSTYNQQGGGSQSTFVKKSFSNPSTSTTTTTQGGTTMDTKRIFQILKEVDTRLYNLEENQKKILEKIEYNTQVDTDKLIGQLQILNDTMLPVLKTQIKKGSELYKEQQKKEDPVLVNHFEKADRHETAFRDRRKIVEEKDQADDDEFERTKQFVPENHNIDDDEDDEKIETED